MIGAGAARTEIGTDQVYVTDPPKPDPIITTSKSRSMAYSYQSICCLCVSNVFVDYGAPRQD